MSSTGRTPGVTFHVPGQVGGQDRKAAAQPNPFQAADPLARRALHVPEPEDVNEPVQTISEFLADCGEPPTISEFLRGCASSAEDEPALPPRVEVRMGWGEPSARDDDSDSDGAPATRTPWLDVSYYDAKSDMPLGGVLYVDLGPEHSDVEPWRLGPPSMFGGVASAQQFRHAMEEFGHRAPGTGDEALVNLCALCCKQANVRLLPTKGGDAYTRLAMDFMHMAPPACQAVLGEFLLDWAEMAMATRGGKLQSNQLKFAANLLRAVAQNSSDPGQQTRAAEMAAKAIVQLASLSQPNGSGGGGAGARRLVRDDPGAPRLQCRRSEVHRCRPAEEKCHGSLPARWRPPRALAPWRHLRHHATRLGASMEGGLALPA
ncbi:hypothetical protein [Ramlibacter albus]|uniref:Uncharacterized protein n=1 Tax=Ramlibacter albus TaxID=2079448 RepID=A0A923M7D6_9BURK|nr:hypothetical protein [Ramlibacter albus]MBC5764171.1 hypothetical protein [Ramlibacter albus]